MGNKPRSPPSIRTMLALLILAGMGPFLLGIGVLVDQFYGRERAQHEADTIQTARALSGMVDHELALGETVAMTLAASPSIETDLAAFHAQASRALQDSLPGVSFVLADVSGQQLVNTARPFGATLPKYGNPDHCDKS